MIIRTQTALALGVVLLALCISAGVAEAPREVETKANLDGRRVHRIVAIGDIHGDPEKFQDVLLRTKVVKVPNSSALENDSFEFSDALIDGVRPTKTTIVQMGDLIDRGNDDRRALNIAFNLYEKQFEQEKDNISHSVELLLGNHELMNLQKHYHYVHKDELGGFLNKVLRDVAFDKAGPYGKFIIDNFKTIHINEGTVFVHAGITSEFLSDFAGEESFNERVRDELRAGNARSALLSSRGPVWTRRTVFEAKAGLCDDLEKTLKLLNADRMVVGHTPERDGHIREYCSGKLFTVDVGLSRWMYDGFAALEIVSVEDPNTISENSPRQVTIWEINSKRRILLWPKQGTQTNDSEDLEDL